MVSRHPVFILVQFRLKIMQLFYAPQILEKHFVFNETESKHCIRVLRHKVGDEVKVIDGKGGMYLVKILDNNPKSTSFEILEKQYQRKKTYYLHIAIAPTKQIERMEWFLEKSTEIGIDEITLLICDHSERKNIKLDRLEKILIAAAKQSVNAYIPRINSPMKFTGIMQTHFTGNKYIAHCYDTEKQLFKKVYSRSENAFILIGPEGDFSNNEVDIALKHHFIPVSLGENRLRTETAGIVACHTVSFINQE